VRHLENEIAVVREQKQALGVGIETARRHEARAGNRDEIGYLLRRVAVGDGGNVAHRLVQGDIIARLLHGDGLAVDEDLLGIGIDHRSRLGDHDPIDAHPTRGDDLLGVPSRGDAGGGERFLKS
jgi:hypothetical protein